MVNTGMLLFFRVSLSVLYRFEKFPIAKIFCRQFVSPLDLSVGWGGMEPRDALLIRVSCSHAFQLD